MVLKIKHNVFRESDPMPETKQVYSFIKNTHIESIQEARPVLRPRSYADLALKEDTI